MQFVNAVNDSSFEREVVLSHGLVVVDFWAEESQPCRLLAPVLAKVAIRFQGRMKIVTCNIRQTIAAGQVYGVKSFPHLLFFQDGVLVNNEIGYLNERHLVNRIEGALLKTPNDGIDPTPTQSDIRPLRR